MDVYTLPNLVVFVNKSEPSGGTEGSVINHVGLKARDLKPYLAKAAWANVTIASQSEEQVFLPYLRSLPETGFDLDPNLLFRTPAGVGAKKSKIQLRLSPSAWPGDRRLICVRAPRCRARENNSPRREHVARSLCYSVRTPPKRAS